MIWVLVEVRLIVALPAETEPPVGWAFGAGWAAAGRVREAAQRAVPASRTARVFGQAM